MHLLNRSRRLVVHNLSSELDEHRQKSFLASRELQGRFLRLMRVGQEAGNEIDQEISRTAMSGMSNLRDVFELIILSQMKDENLSNLRAFWCLWSLL